MLARHSAKNLLRSMFGDAENATVGAWFRVPLRIGGTLSIAAILLLLAACQHSTAKIISETTASVTVNEPSPVRLSVVVVRQEGSVHDNSLSIAVAATVVNETSSPIGILVTGRGPYPPVTFQLKSTYGTKIWDNIPMSNGANTPPYDATTIAPGDSYTWNMTLRPSPSGLIDGLTFLLTASITWHQGALTANGEINGASGTANSQQSIVLT